MLFNEVENGDITNLKECVLEQIYGCKHQSFVDENEIERYHLKEKEDLLKKINRLNSMSTLELQNELENYWSILTKSKKIEEETHLKEKTRITNMLLKIKNWNEPEIFKQDKISLIKTLEFRLSCLNKLDKKIFKEIIKLNIYEYRQSKIDEYLENINRHDQENENELRLAKDFNENYAILIKSLE